MNTKPVVTAIACCSPSFHIGNEGKLLGRVPGDLAMFKGLTEGNVVVMGWNTFASIGKPLPYRTNVVYVDMLRLDDEQANLVERCTNAGVIFRSTLSETLSTGIELANTSGRGQCFVIGGGVVYRYALESGLVDRIILTIAHKSLEPEVGDTLFPYDLLTNHHDKWIKTVRPLIALGSPEVEGLAAVDLVETYIKRNEV